MSANPMTAEHEKAGVRVPFTVDDLAQEIRRVDGKHDLGAGALAEALMPFLSAPSVPAVADLSKDGLTRGTAQKAEGDLPEFTQGICEDGAAILKDGLPMTVEEILDALADGAAARAALDLPDPDADPKAVDAAARSIEPGKDEEEKGSLVQVTCGECRGLGCGCCDYDGYFIRPAASKPGKGEERLREADNDTLTLICKTAARFARNTGMTLDQIAEAALRLPECTLAALSPSRGEADTSQDRAACKPEGETHG